MRRKIDPTGISGAKCIQQWQKQVFPDAQYLDNKELRRGIFNYNGIKKSS